MRKLVCLTAVVGALVAIGAESPAMAAVGQCYDAYGRPVGPPHDTDNPPYGLICSVYRRGGSCTHVQYSWAVSNCGLAPRYRYRDDDDYYEYPRRRRYWNY